MFFVCCRRLILEFCFILLSGEGNLGRFVFCIVFLLLRLLDSVSIFEFFWNWCRRKFFDGILLFGDLKIELLLKFVRRFCCWGCFNVGIGEGESGFLLWLVSILVRLKLGGNILGIFCKGVFWDMFLGNLKLLLFLFRFILVVWKLLFKFFMCILLGERIEIRFEVILSGEVVFKVGKVCLFILVSCFCKSCFWVKRVFWCWMKLLLFEFSLKLLLFWNFCWMVVGVLIRLVFVRRLVWWLFFWFFELVIVLIGMFMLLLIKGVIFGEVFCFKILKLLKLLERCWVVWNGVFLVLFIIWFCFFSCWRSFFFFLINCINFFVLLLLKLLVVDKFGNVFIGLLIGFVFKLLGILGVFEIDCLFLDFRVLRIGLGMFWLIEFLNCVWLNWLNWSCVFFIILFREFDCKLVLILLLVVLIFLLFGKEVVVFFVFVFIFFILIFLIILLRSLLIFLVLIFSCFDEIVFSIEFEFMVGNGLGGGGGGGGGLFMMIMLLLFLIMICEGGIFGLIIGGFLIGIFLLGVLVLMKDKYRMLVIVIKSFIFRLIFL